MNKTKDGFTLIELLVVVAVLGILAAVVSTRFHSAVERADAAASQANLRTLFTALQSYRIDYNQFPLADGLADSVPQPDKTAYGCGPAANGYWSGVPMILVELDYCSSNALYDPAFFRTHNLPMEAYPSCSESSFAGESVAGWHFLRYAYNAAALDGGGFTGGEHNIELTDRADVWLIRSLHLNVGAFDPVRSIDFPYPATMANTENPSTIRGEFELTLGGEIRFRIPG